MYGQWGSCTWTLDDLGTLTISPGQGAFSEPAWDCYSWGPYKDAIKSVYAVSNGNEKVVAPESISYMFSSCSNLTTIDLSEMDVSGVKDMYHAFALCPSLISVNLSGWDTGSVTNMAELFCGCNSIESLDLSALNTSNVTNLSAAFADCKDLTDLKVSNWNTSKVEDISSMFYSCTSLVNLDLSGWNVSQVKNMQSAFDCSSKLASIKGLSTWNTGNVQNMKALFCACEALAAADVSGWNMSNVTDASWMFMGCNSLRNLDLSRWNTSKMTTSDSMFMACGNLASIGDVSGWNVSNIVQVENMFESCAALKSLNFSGWDTSGFVGGLFGNASQNTMQSLESFSIGTKYAMNSDKAIPELPDGYIWKSTTTGRTYKNIVIRNTRQGIADTYVRSIDYSFWIRASDWTYYDGIDWFPVYDAVFYAESNPDVARWATEADGYINGDKLLAHFVNNGMKEGRRSKDDFELASYYNANANLRRAFGTDWARYYRHYATDGAWENRTCAGVGSLRGAMTSRDGVNWAPVYDAIYYAAQNGDVARWASRKCGADTVLDDAALLQHFVNNGQKERRQAKSTFNVTNYRNRYADLNRAFGDNWPSYYRHFATNGYRENRNGA